jgi:hypothetical protein
MTVFCCKDGLLAMPFPCHREPAVRFRGRGDLRSRPEDRFVARPPRNDSLLG